MSFENNESITRSSTATTGVAIELTTVYHGPDASVYAQVGSIGPNETVNILAKSMNWYHIEYTVGTTTQRKTGYVPMSALSNIQGATITEEDFYGGYCYAITELDVRTCDIFSNTAAVGTLFENEGCTMLFSYFVGDKEIAFIEYSTSSGTKRGYVYAQYLRFPIETIVGIANEYIKVYGGPDFENSAVFGTIYKNELISVLAKQGNVIYVEYNTVKGRKRGYIDWRTINPRDYTDEMVFNNFYTLKDNSDCHIKEEIDGVDVYAGPSTSYAKIGKVNCENIVCFWTNNEQYPLTCIEYLVTTTGKIKRGYIDPTKVNVGQLPFEENELEALDDEYQYFVRNVYGKTQRNRDMVYYRMGTGNNHIFLTFALHGWEDGKKADGTYYHGDGNMLIKIAKKFMKKFETLSSDKIIELQNKWSIFVFPGINLDGIVEGNSNNSFGRCLYSGLDPNRNWPGNFKVYTSSRYKTGYKYLGNELDGSDAIELVNLKNIISVNAGTELNVLVDVHGWLNQTIGNETVAKYYCDSFGIPEERHQDGYGSGYLITWAKNMKNFTVSEKNYPGISAASCLLELPPTQDYSDVKMTDYANKFFNGTLNILEENGETITYPENVIGDDFEKLFKKLKRIYEYADAYMPNCSVLEKNIAVLEYLRKDDYGTVKYDSLYGLSNKAFINIVGFIEFVEGMIDEYDPDWLSPENIIVPDSVIMEGIPISHLAATLNGYVQDNALFKDDDKENDTNQLGGWAGDLIQMGRAFERKNIVLTVEKAQEIIGSNDISCVQEYNTPEEVFSSIKSVGFSYEDWTHDIDAVCIADFLKEQSIDNAFRSYYTDYNLYKNRYRLFIEKAIQNGFVNGIPNRFNIYSCAKKYLYGENDVSAIFVTAMKYLGLNKKELAKGFANKLLELYGKEINQSFPAANIRYSVHCENIGWQSERKNGEYAGTEGQGLRLEAIKINADIPIEYRAHVEKVGWTPWVTNGQVAGTEGRGLRMEAIEIKSSRNPIWGQAHVQNIGYQNPYIGQQILIGTEGQGLRLEGVKLEMF